MHLNDLVNELIAVTGRYDLRSPLGNTIRAVRRLNEAQRFLDLRIKEDDDQLARTYAVITPGLNNFYVPYLRYPTEVRLVTTEQRQALIKADVEDLELYFNKPIALQEPGVPIYWTHGVQTMSPAVESSDAHANTTYADYNNTQTTLYSGMQIAVYPYPDTTYNVEIIGAFFTPDFGNGVTHTRWGEQYPQLLLLATQYILETYNRNREGQRDLLDAIDTQLTDIAFDKVSMKIYGDFTL